MLNSLHSIPLDQAREWGMDMDEYVSTIEQRQRYARSCLDWLSANYDSAISRKLDGILSKVDQTEYRYNKVLVHGDLLPEHLIIDEKSNTIKGIIDWTDARFGDPAADFVGLYLWQGKTFVERMIAEYKHESGDHIWQRIQQSAVRCIIGEIQYGAKRQRPSYVEGALSWLQNVEHDL
jgi:aminoglycoside 2''-phosphotransferase